MCSDFFQLQGETVESEECEAATEKASRSSLKDNLTCPIVRFVCSTASRIAL